MAKAEAKGVSILLTDVVFHKFDNDSTRPLPRYLDIQESGWIGWS
jgi:hypothetical protein